MKEKFWEECGYSFTHVVSVDIYQSVYYSVSVTPQGTYENTY